MLKHNPKIFTILFSMFIFSALIFTHDTKADQTKIGTGRVKIIFRLDDPSSLSDTTFEKNIISIFKSHNIPITFGVIPYRTKGDFHNPAQQDLVPLTQEKANIFKEAVKAGTLEIAQHGYSHQTTHVPGTAKGDYWTEFNGADYNTQLLKLKTGRELLQKMTGLEINTFIPPWNTYDLTTVSALKKLGYSTISAGPGGVEDNRSGLLFLQAQCGLAGNEMETLVDKTLTTATTQKPSIIVVLFHQYDFTEVSPQGGTINYAGLGARLTKLAARKDIEFTTFSTIANFKAANPEEIGIGNNPIFMDFNNDGQKELTSLNNGQIYAYNNKGILPGFPWNTHFNPNTSLAIVDLTGYGQKNIIGGCNKGLCVYDSNGSMLSGWPQKLSGTMEDSTPSIADVDKDGQKEIIVGTNSDGNNSSKIYIFHPDGTLMEGWPKKVSSYLVANPVIADIDGDGTFDIIFVTQDGLIHVWDSNNGNALSGWPKKILKNAVCKNAPAVADLDNDGKKEIVLGNNLGVLVYKFDGSILTGWPQNTAGAINSAPSIGDVDGDGQLEITAGSVEGYVYLWKMNGQSMPNWPILTTSGNNVTSPVLLDIDHNGKLEIAAISNDEKVYAKNSSPKDGNIYIWNYTGSPVEGWPQLKPAGQQSSAPIFGDFYGDSKLELITSTNNHLYTCKLPNATTLPWSIPRYDFQRTGYYSYKNNDAEIIIYQQPKSVKSGESVNLKVKVTNNGYDTWKSGYDSVTKTYNNKAYDCRPHLCDKYGKNLRDNNGKLLGWDLYVLTGVDKTGNYYGNDFGKNVKPGETVWMTFNIPTIGKNAGLFQKGASYTLKLDVVHELVAWFGQEELSQVFIIK
ncbi:MAG: VCBS repeat-containing protein [Candidatus Omnitrophica bacterium]|nr:VCBS repeat-containing protein [Candidatus Omnitrophota bacterium]